MHTTFMSREAKVYTTRTRRWFGYLKKLFIFLRGWVIWAHMGSMGPKGPPMDPNGHGLNGPRLNGPKWAQAQWAQMGPGPMGPNGPGPNGPKRARAQMDSGPMGPGP